MTEASKDLDIIKLFIESKIPISDYNLSEAIINFGMIIIELLENYGYNFGRYIIENLIWNKKLKDENLIIYLLEKTTYPIDFYNKAINDAVIRNLLDVVKYLYFKGFKPDCSEFIEAIKNKSRKTVQFLINQGLYKSFLDCFNYKGITENLKKVGWLDLVKLI